MKALRSVVLVLSTASLIACQTLAAPGAGLAPSPSANSTAVSRSSAVATSVSTNAPSYAAQNKAMAAEMGGSHRKTIMIVAVVAAIVVAAIIIAGGGSGSSY